MDAGSVAGRWTEQGTPVALLRPLHSAVEAILERHHLPAGPPLQDSRRSGAPLAWGGFACAAGSQIGGTQQVSDVSVGGILASEMAADGDADVRVERCGGGFAPSVATMQTELALLFSFRFRGGSQEQPRWCVRLGFYWACASTVNWPH